jgi:hypothetical protein
MKLEPAWTGILKSARLLPTSEKMVTIAPPLIGPSYADPTPIAPDLI